MSGRLEGKVAIVTGASSGIGAVSAVTLAREGAKVAVVARRPAEGGEVADAASRAGEANGGEGRFVQADVTDERAVMEMIETVRGWWGPSLHVLFNNAGGVVGGGRFPRERLGNFEATLRLSLTSVWLVTQACWEALSNAGGSSIITNSTVGAAMVLPSGPLANSAGYPHSGYNAAKAGVEALTRYFAQEGAQGGIRANCIRPGQIETPAATAPDGKHFFHQLITPMQVIVRPGISSDLANMVLFLASEESSFITAQVLNVDGGLAAKI